MEIQIGVGIDIGIEILVLIGKSIRYPKRGYRVGDRLIRFGLRIYSYYYPIILYIYNI